MSALPVFSMAEFGQAKKLLATQVSLMMGRKYEEGDWAEIYETVKKISRSSWSNLSIDVMHGNLGVEHKMLCRPDTRPILTECGLDLMHPAGTRSIRIPAEEDATKCARDVLRQYGELIKARSLVVQTVHLYHHSQLRRGEALEKLTGELRYGRQAAEALLPKERSPVGNPYDLPDMRLGWLLWKNSLDEFLYFEEPMEIPDPEQFRAEWRESGGGRRLKSRNLWVYHKSTGRKFYSITTAAGAKIQPYFHVPAPNDANLYHFIVQGEKVSSGNRIMWLQRDTAATLKKLAGGLDSNSLDSFFSEIDFRKFSISESPSILLAKEAKPIEISSETYFKIKDNVESVSDQHAIQVIIDLL